jgi:5-formyltetrahydrofolate cyclo-ligase
MEISSPERRHAMVEAKRALRKRMLAARDAVSAEQRATWSARICERAIELPAYQSARVIHCFVSIQSEVETRALITHALAHGKRVAAPLFVKGSPETPAYKIETLDAAGYETGDFGLAVPRDLKRADLDTIDLFFVPLLAFAAVTVPGAVEKVKFSRLGYGIAYYDRLLARSHGRRVGLAFALQRVESLPLDTHDQLLDDVLTEQ